MRQLFSSMPKLFAIASLVAGSSLMHAQTVFGPGPAYQNLGDVQISDYPGTLVFHWPGVTVDYITVNKADTAHNMFRFRAGNPNSDGPAGIDVEGNAVIGNVLHVSGSTGPSLTSQGAYIGWNAYTGGTGETDFINSQGGGPGGFAFMKANSDGSHSNLDFIDGNGNFNFMPNMGQSITFSDGTVQTTAWNGVLTGGDYAESVDISGERETYEPGDVLVIDPTAEGRFQRSAKPYSTAVTGIYSTRPGVTGRRQQTPREAMKGEVPMAMTGIVPTKVSAENGPIRPGDLLVTSSRAGYAMHGTDRMQMLGAVLGKAIGHLDSGTGVIEAVVTLQ